MTDLKSRADELIAATGRAIGYDEVMETRAALTRFVHALCDVAAAANSLSLCFKSGNGIPVERATILGASVVVQRLNTALAALEKGEKA